MPKSAIPIGSEFGPNRVDLVRMQGKALHVILQELESENTKVNSKVLEILALYFVQLLGLEFKGWQKRSKDTVKLFADETELLFSRWQIRCQNTFGRDILVDDIAEEVGFSLKFKSNVILVATTGEFSKEALTYADGIMRLTNLNIITIDRQELNALAKSLSTGYRGHSQ